MSLIGVSTNVAEAGVEDNTLCVVDLNTPYLTTVIGGPPIDGFFVGYPYLVRASLLNHCDQEMPFVAFIEVRESMGVTVSLHNQTGVIQPNSGQTEIGVSWRPEESGIHELRAFAISNFTNPEILTEVKSNQVEILE